METYIEVFHRRCKHIWTCHIYNDDVFFVIFKAVLFFVFITLYKYCPKKHNVIFSGNSGGINLRSCECFKTAIGIMIVKKYYIKSATVCCIQSDNLQRRLITNLFYNLKTQQEKQTFTKITDVLSMILATTFVHQSYL